MRSNRSGLAGELDLELFLELAAVVHPRLSLTGISRSVDVFVDGHYGSTMLLLNCFKVFL